MANKILKTDNVSEIAIYSASGVLRTVYTNTRLSNNMGQDAQLSQRDRAARCVIVFAKSRRLELGDNILRTV